MNLRMKLVGTYMLVLGIAVVPLVAFADQPGRDRADLPTLPDPLQGGASTQTFDALVPKVIDALLQIGIVVIVIAFIWAGFKYVTAMGDEKQIGEAHKIFKYTVIGAAILLGSQALATVIKGTIDAIRANS